MTRTFLLWLDGLWRVLICLLIAGGLLWGLLWLGKHDHWTIYWIVFGTPVAFYFLICLPLFIGRQLDRTREPK